MTVHMVKQSVIENNAPLKEMVLCKPITNQDELWQLHAILADCIKNGEKVEVEIWQDFQPDTLHVMRESQETR